MNLTVVYITARLRPQARWVIDGLLSQIRGDDDIQLVIVDSLSAEDIPDIDYRTNLSVTITRPKPTVWQGPHRLTPMDCWAASNARNTGICLAKHDWIAFLDDRCVILRNWMNAIRNARQRGYALFGTYEKRTGMTVDRGVIRHAGIVIGEDSRLKYVQNHWENKAPVDCPGSWSFGCTLALPLEWVLNVNGFEELMDGLGAEDIQFGTMLETNGYPTKFDYRMAIVEDRTPEESLPVMFKTSKEKHPYDTTDKGHAAVKRFFNQKRTQHQWNLRDVRDRVLSGNEFPIPSGPTEDWFDGQPLSEYSAERKV